MKTTNRKNPISKAIVKKKVQKRAEIRNVSRETLHKNSKRDFLDLDKLSASELRSIIDHAKDLKADNQKLLADKFLAQIYEKPSTRTRISFEVGMKQLGGEVLTLDSNSMQLGRGESVSDTAKVLSRMVNLVMLRANSHDTLLELAEHATVPVINGLTDYSHPCQIMADILTYEEHRDSIKGAKVAWVGDWNNVLVSWIHAAAKFDFELSIACPKELLPAKSFLDKEIKNGANLVICDDPAKAAKKADLVVTDTWFSMGEKNPETRRNLLVNYQVDEKLMKKAKKEALFMHCLPAHRGEEVSAEVIDGKQSVVWDEAENRLHAQKAIMAWCLNAI